jgi:hypothetical protein
MTKPGGDGGNVDPRLEQVHGRCVPDYMRRNTRRVTGRDPGALYELVQDVGDAGSAEPAAMDINKQRLTFEAAFGEPCRESFYCSRPE